MAIQSNSDNGPRVLIVEDDEHICKIARAILNHNGYKRISETSDPVQALRKIQKGYVDFVFLDWKLPQMSGLELVKSVRNAAIDIPIIMVTGQKDKEMVLSALKAGASDYIVKPFSGRTLVEKMEETLAKRKAEDDRLRKQGMSEWD